MNPGHQSRRQCLLAGAALLAPWHRQADANTLNALPLARDLPAEMALAAQRAQPLLVLVSLHGCVYCERVRRSNLLPRLAEGQAVVQVDLKSSLPVLDWRGRPSTHDELTRLWKVSIAPTVLFFGPSGKELAERMVGAYQPDFYDAYLDDRLAQARQRL
ncbi:MAG: thioredoxin fold domain-containing protein [Betaproteobacteria bacterium]